MPKVTVIIPTVGRPELQQAIDSVNAQTFKDFELLVEHDTERVGKSIMVNNAVKKAKGEYILVVDDDNVIAPQFLELTVKAIEEESEKEMRWSNSEWHAVTTGRIVVHEGYKDYAPAYYQQGLGFAAIDWGWLIRKKVFDVIQYDETLFGDEDADFGIQFYKNFRAYALDLPLQTAFAQSNDGVCLPTVKRLASLDRFIEKNWREYEEAGPKDLSFLYRFAGRNYYLAGWKKIATNYFWKCFKAWPTRRTAIHFLTSLISYKAYYLLMRLEEKYYSRKRLQQANLKI